MMKATSSIVSEKGCIGAGYSSDNLRKYQSSNPIKRYLVSRMQHKLLELAAECCRCLCVDETMDQSTGKADTIRILDAGCGEGINAALLEKQLPDAKITLLDASESALEYAKTMCSDKCIFECGSVTELPFTDREFDLVICTEVLEHLEKPGAALSELMRVSKGFVLISVPHEPWFRTGNLITLKNVKRLGDPPDHLNHWTSDGFRKWIPKRTKEWKSSFYRSFPWQFALLEHIR